jgi:hypothetical protein
VPRVKEARPCEDTLEAHTKQGVTVIPLKKHVKPFVRNEKGVIGVFELPQGLL